MNMYHKYTRDLCKSLDEMPWDVIDTIVEVLHAARLKGNHIFIMGNGGSAATALHMACDLGKNTDMPNVPRMRVMSLADNMALFSAHANDNSYENVFAEQLASFARQDDVAIAISASGNSPNVLNGITRAKSLGATTIGWSGHDGGKLADMVDYPVVVPNNCTEQIEDVHMILEHMVTLAMREAVCTGSKTGTDAAHRGFAQPIV